MNERTQTRGAASEPHEGERLLGVVEVSTILSKYTSAEKLKSDRLQSKGRTQRQPKGEKQKTVRTELREEVGRTFGASTQLATKVLEKEKTLQNNTLYMGEKETESTGGHYDPITRGAQFPQGSFGGPR